MLKDPDGLVGSGNGDEMTAVGGEVQALDKRLLESSLVVLCPATLGLLLLLLPPAASVHFFLVLGQASFSLGLSLTFSGFLLALFRNGYHLAIFHFPLFSRGSFWDGRLFGGLDGRSRGLNRGLLCVGLLLLDGVLPY